MVRASRSRVMKTAAGTASRMASISAARRCAASSLARSACSVRLREVMSSTTAAQ
jgi:hypothetical protein